MQNPSPHSLSEGYQSVAVPPAGKRIRRFLAFVGPGYLVSVGYMDPGNWATDLAGGSKFGYTLLSVILLSNLMAVLLQALSARLGIATGYDLAQACRVSYPRSINLTLWFLCELAIISCDLAEVIGTAIALKLLFHIPLLWGVILTALDTFLILLLMNKGFRWLEAFIISLILIIAGCFVAQMMMAIPPIKEILQGFIPSSEIVTNSEMLYIAIGIIGATVMPHNLYLHSALVQTRDFERTPEGRRQALRWAVTDSTIALTFALFVNAAILIVSASVFHQHGYHDVVEIDQAHALLSPVLGVSIASTLFAIALLAAGINSSVTATLAGQIVMEGFLNLRLAPWLRRFLTRGLAIIPVIIVTWFYGEKGTAQLLIFSQIILSMQLPFAIVPLLMFVGDQKKMGIFCLSKGLKILTWIIAGIIICLNMKLLIDTFF